ncbi:MAG: low temperature requirement protein A [Solirubrobacterales bacterium]|nr:low temperature requirement protein A [Solirubrobacterales bacterium]
MREQETVTPLELFFDLVFVRAFTQCTALMADEPTWQGLAKGLLVRRRTCFPTRSIRRSGGDRRFPVGDVPKHVVMHRAGRSSKHRSPFAVDSRYCWRRKVGPTGSGEEVPAPGVVAS